MQASELLARVERLEKLVADLCLALHRQDTALDGNWGWPATLDELTRIADELRHNKNFIKSK